MRHALYIGKSGELAARSEFLLHGYNVAVPDVDVGDDIFVVEDASGTVWRVQVRTTLGKRKRSGWSGRFCVSLTQLRAELRPQLVYVFALRKDTGQWEFVVIPHRDLREEFDDHGIGSVHEDRLWLHMAFHETELLCSSRDLQRYRNQLVLPAVP